MRLQTAFRAYFPDKQYLINVNFGFRLPRVVVAVHAKTLTLTYFRHRIAALPAGYGGTRGFTEVGLGSRCRLNTLAPLTCSPYMLSAPPSGVVACSAEELLAGMQDDRIGKMGSRLKASCDKSFPLFMGPAPPSQHRMLGIGLP